MILFFFFSYLEDTDSRSSNPILPQYFAFYQVKKKLRNILKMDRSEDTNCIIY